LVLASVCQTSIILNPYNREQRDFMDAFFPLPFNFVVKISLDNLFGSWASLMLLTNRPKGQRKKNILITWLFILLLVVKWKTMNGFSFSVQHFVLFLAFSTYRLVIEGADDLKTKTCEWTKCVDYATGECTQQNPCGKCLLGKFCSDHDVTNACFVLCVCLYSVREFFHHKLLNKIF